MKFLLGLLIGAIIVKLIRRARWRRPLHMRGFGCHRRWRRVGWLLRELDLDPRQKDELGALWLSARRTIGEAQVARWRVMGDLADAAVADPVDPARLEELAARHADAQARLGKEAAAAVTRLHEILRPEQRARLRELVERAGLWRFSRAEAAPAGDGPYR